MKEKIFLFLMVWAFLTDAAQADVKVETVCYGSQLRDHSAGYYGLLLRTYYDEDLKREIGAFVQYNKKSFIPVVFEKIIKTDQNDPELGNFELRRTEIINGKETGVYLLIQSGAGVKQGSYLEYRSKKTNESSRFFEIGREVDCVEVCISRRCRFQPRQTR
jgi:hypothetical protein